MPKTFAIIDGSSYFYRAFYAIPRLTNSKGMPTNAALGFSKMLIRVQKQLKPDYLAVVFDKAEKTFRNDLYKEYKAHRPPMPDELSVQIPYIKEIPRAFNVYTIEMDNYEADDIIATLATQGAKNGLKSIIVSLDKDLMQLITKESKDESPGVVLYDDTRDRFVGIQETIEKFGVPPEKMRDLQALMGDSSDNIPGVKGIGAKTAAKLIQQFGTVDNLLASLDKITPPRMKTLIESGKEDLLLSRKLVTLECRLNLKFKLDDFRIKEPNRVLLTDLFTQLEFSTLQREFEGPREIAQTDIDVKHGFAKDIKNLQETVVVFAIIPDEPMVAYPDGIAFHDGRQTIYIKKDDLDTASIKEISKHKVISYDVNSLLVSIRKLHHLEKIDMDLMMASYLLNPDAPQDLPKINKKLLGTDIAGQKDLFSSGKEQNISQEKLGLFAAQNAKACWELYPKLTKELQDEGLYELLKDVEMPLTRVLADMEIAGVKIDTDYLENLSDDFGARLDKIQKKAYELAGEEFNLDSPKQLSHILFEKLGLKPTKKTQTGFSTDVSVLEDLTKAHPLPEKLIEHRTLAKLKHGYIDALPKMVLPETSRVHTRYNQAIASTGRIISSNPNLQNIPIKTQEGRLIRKAFVAERGFTLVWGDYSQIELRLLAHLSQDPLFVNAFKEDKDIHSQTAIEVFQVLPGMVTPDMRRKAKEINFSIIYGISPHGLYLRTGIPVKQSAEYINRYFARYSGVKTFMAELVERARKEGSVRTILDRKRFVPGIDSSNSTVRKQAERLAINTPIQGSAADLIKLAMINLHRKLKKPSRLIMQVHDELVVEAKEAEAEEVAELLRKEMSNVYKLSVPLKVDTHISKTWEKE